VTLTSAHLPSLPPPNTARFTLPEVALATNGKILRGEPSLELRGVVTDTRLIAPTLEASASTCGPLFVALRGENFDGHDLAAQALEAGAGALLVERELDIDAPQVLVSDTRLALGALANAHRRRFSSLLIVAVTGSYGKTTTRALIEAALSPRFQVLASEGNFNNEIGLPLTLLRLDESYQAAVVEMGMRGPNQIEYLAQVAEPNIGVVTNVGPQHIELLGSQRAITQAKGELLESLQQSGVCIIPDEGEGSQVLREVAGSRQTRLFGSSGQADVQVLTAAPLADGGTRCVFGVRGGASLEVKLPLFGVHNAHNAAAALCVALAIGSDLEEAARGLEKVDVPGARMKLRVLEEKKMALIDDSYNAGPNSMRAALHVLGGMPDALRRVAVLGSMKELGAWSPDEHRKIGILAASIVQVLVGVGEETKPMLEAAGEIEKMWFATAAEAAPALQVLAREGDAVLIKGSRSVGLEVVVNALEA